MKPDVVLKNAAALVGERGADYGGIENNFSHIASVANTMLDLNLTAFDIAIIMTAVKVARIRQSPYKEDNYLDAINYLAFAHELRPAKDNPVEDASEEEVEEFKKAFGFA